MLIIKEGTVQRQMTEDEFVSTLYRHIAVPVLKLLSARFAIFSNDVYYTFMVVMLDYTFECDHKQLKYFLNKGIKAEGFKLTKDNRIYLTDKSIRPRRVMLPAKDIDTLRNIVDNYYVTLERKCKTLGIPYKRDDIQVTDSGVILYKVYTPINGVYTVPPFITEVKGDNAAFCGLSGNLKVVNKNTALWNAELMFSQCTVKNLDLTEFDTTNIINMRGMFSSCLFLKSLDLRSWNVSSVKTMELMFSNCRELQEVRTGIWNVSRVRSMRYMFWCCSLLRLLDIAQWDVSRVCDFSSAFYSCGSLTNLDLSGWQLNAKVKMKGTFGYSAIPLMQRPIGYQKVYKQDTNKVL